MAGDIELVVGSPDGKSVIKPDMCYAVARVRPLRGQLKTGPDKVAYVARQGRVIGQPGNRQAGRTILGAVGSGDVALTVDGLAIEPWTGNSLPLAQNYTFIAIGYVVAKSSMLNFIKI